MIRKIWWYVISQWPSYKMLIVWPNVNKQYHILNISVSILLSLNYHFQFCPILLDLFQHWTHGPNIISTVRVQKSSTFPYFFINPLYFNLMNLWAIHMKIVWCSSSWILHTLKTLCAGGVLGTLYLPVSVHKLWDESQMITLDKLIPIMFWQNKGLFIFVHTLFLPR